MSDNSFDARSTLALGGRELEIFRLDALQSSFDVARLPFSLKVLLENLLRNEDGVAVRREDVEALATWDAKAEPSKEIAFTPARSEEHTSELQSRQYLVCRLLLEKKKTSTL